MCRAEGFNGASPDGWAAYLPKYRACYERHLQDLRLQKPPYTYIGDKKNMAAPVPTLSDIGSKADALGAELLGLKGDIGNALAKITAVASNQEAAQATPPASPDYTKWILLAVAAVAGFFIFRKFLK